MTSVYPWLKKLKAGLVLYLSIIVYCELSFAQITPDNTLGRENSLVNTNVEVRGNLADLIQGGAIRDGNLFHSFGEFNIGEGGRVFFANPDGITNIITRITGNNFSEILGTLGVDGGANLFFLNPNGIVFGENAQLDISGSFLATTADSYSFENGTEFSATQPEAPLLTINFPLGVQFGGNPGGIQVQGQGHNYTMIGLSPLIPTAPTQGLQINPGNTLSLIGGDISLEGGNLIAPGGRIELGSVGKGLVNLTPTDFGWVLNYQGVESFQDVNLSQEASVDASGGFAGSIQVQGNNINLADGSGIVIQNLGFQPSGDINIRAIESLELQGNTPVDILTSFIANDALGLGAGGNINIDANRILLTGGASISSNTFSDAQGGDIALQVAQSLQVIGFEQNNPQNTSYITAASLGSGNAGNVNANTKDLNLIDGGLISTISFSTGNAGNLLVNVADSFQLIGTSPFFTPSTLSSSTFGSGKSGNLTLNTSQLIIQDGGRVDASTVASGNAGSVEINATDFIEVRGTVPNSINPSLIISSANIIDPSLRDLLNSFFPLNLSSLPSGDSGNVTINTPQLTITDGASVTVRNDGFGDAGNLNINADNLFLNTLGSTTASTQSGEGGNLNLSLTNLLQLRNGGQISAAAGGIGNGGNITINADIILSLENSRINANAFAGNGGNIQINTQGIFLGNNASITASSEFGVDGVISINTPISEPKNAFVELRAQIVGTDVQIARRCGSEGVGRENSFVVTGRGGLAPSPDSLGLAESIVPDLGTGGETLLEDREIGRRGDGHRLTNPQSTIVEAQGWIINERGKVELVAYPVGIGSSELEQKMTNCGSLSSYDQNT